ncbi:hypothetical protein B5D80_03775 [Micromonospora wenchangensis]|uniref:Uncharacterized protein n=1 Tax=Micromonospora wenchangensis TaxID=1185415 RepID=A0A246RSE0_9ACTN|nr:hypothetical protein [Micromonospora wenchangensis]OWV12030.1 hypothetical protein B5D80_03775 [Micromonospora wenchangensis]
MEARLQPVNAILGLVIAGDVNPPLLADAGFRVVGLEVPAVGPAGKAVIDVLLFHEATNHLVQCESKSGANIEEGQARAYAAMPAANAVQAAYVNLRHRTTPTIETLYLCLEEHAERIRLGLKTIDIAFPVLGVGYRRLELHDDEYASELLRAPLQGGVTLKAPPPRLIAFDPESPAEAVERQVRPTMVAELSKRTSHISLTGLTERVAPHYGLYGHAAQNKLKSVVRAAVVKIAEATPDRFAFDPPANSRPEGLIRFLRTPEDHDPRGRTQAYQALARMGQATPRRRRAATNPNPDQMDLLSELSTVDNDAEDIDTMADEEGSQS